MEDALHEMTTSRDDLKVLMQPRFRTQQSVPRAPNCQNDNDRKRPLALMDRQPPKGKGKKGKDKDKGKGKGKCSKNNPGSHLCDRWSKGQCKTGKCNYVHRCNKMVGGKLCAERHPAGECPHGDVRC